MTRSFTKPWSFRRDNGTFGYDVRRILFTGFKDVLKSAILASASIPKTPSTDIAGTASRRVIRIVAR